MAGSQLNPQNSVSLIAGSAPTRSSLFLWEFVEQWLSVAHWSLPHSSGSQGPGGVLAGSAGRPVRCSCGAFVGPSFLDAVPEAGDIQERAELASSSSRGRLRDFEEFMLKVTGGVRRRVRIGGDLGTGCNTARKSSMSALFNESCA